MKKEHAKALFEMAGFTVKSMHELPNGYWPEAYTQHRAANPWWLVETQFGLIRIGRRKRVWSINWESTPFRCEVTGDNVTKNSEMVHAWTYPKMMEYLIELQRKMIFICGEGA